MREAKSGQARRGVDLISASVTRLLGRRAVVAQSVCFHDQPELGPEEVDAEPVDVLTRFRPGQASSADKPEEEPLQLGVRQAKEAAIEEAPEHGHTRLARHLLERCAEGLGID